MSKFINIIDNETIEISDYRNPNAVFKTREYADYDSLCIFKEVINPFVLYGENKQLKKQLQQKESVIKEVREILNQDKASASFNTTERIALEILDKENK